MWVVPGQDRVALAVGEVDERPLHPQHRRVERVDRPPRPEAEIRGHLVVPGAAGVELPGQRSDPLGEGLLEVHVDVLEGRVPGQRPRLHLGAQAVEARHERLDLVGREQARPSQPPHVGDRSGQVVEGQRTVDIDRAGEVGRQRIRRAREPPAPEPHTSLRLAPPAAAAGRPGPAARRPPLPWPLLSPAPAAMVPAARSPPHARPAPRSAGRPRRPGRPRRARGAWRATKTISEPKAP